MLSLALAPAGENPKSSLPKDMSRAMERMQAARRRLTDMLSLALAPAGEDDRTSGLPWEVPVVEAEAEEEPTLLQDEPQEVSG